MFSDSEVNMCLHDKLVKCREEIEHGMNKTQYFLLGFFLCSKYIKDKKCIENDNFTEIYNEFLCDYIIDSKKNIFEINEQTLPNNLILIEKKIDLKNEVNKKINKSEGNLYL